MPLSSESIRNKPLGGRELLEIAVNDFRDLLSKDGMFAEYVGYGRVAYQIHFSLHMDNLTYPRHDLSRASKRNPEVGVEVFPLAGPSAEAVALDLSRDREIVSPNAARVLNDLPISVGTVIDGYPVQRKIMYPKDQVPPQPDPVDRDNSQNSTTELRRRAKP